MRSILDLLRSALLWLSGGLTFVVLSWLLAASSYIVNRRILNRLMYYYARAVLFAVRWRLVKRGEEHLRNLSGAVILVGNHVNLIDPFVIKAGLDVDFYPLELIDHFRWPVYGRLIRALGHIPIRHGGGVSNAGSLNEAVARLQQGDNILMLPEGHRTRDGKLGVFHRGAFKLAFSAGASIVPFSMQGLYALQQRGSPVLRSGTVIVQIHHPLHPRDFADPEALLDAVRAVIAGDLESEACAGLVNLCTAQTL